MRKIQHRCVSAARYTGVYSIESFTEGCVKSFNKYKKKLKTMKIKIYILATIYKEKCSLRCLTKWINKKKIRIIHNTILHCSVTWKKVWIELVKANRYLVTKKTCSQPQSSKNKFTPNPRRMLEFKITPRKSRNSRFVTPKHVDYKKSPLSTKLRYAFFTHFWRSYRFIWFSVTFKYNQQKSINMKFITTSFPCSFLREICIKFNTMSLVGKVRFWSS